MLPTGNELEVNLMAMLNTSAIHSPGVSSLTLRAARLPGNQRGATGAHNSAVCHAVVSDVADTKAAGWGGFARFFMQSQGYGGSGFRVEGSQTSSSVLRGGCRPHERRVCGSDKDLKRLFETEQPRTRHRHEEIIFQTNKRVGWFMRHQLR